jgi:hypothetical protein
MTPTAPFTSAGCAARAPPFAARLEGSYNQAGGQCGCVVIGEGAVIAIVRWPPQRSLGAARFNRDDDIGMRSRMASEGARARWAGACGSGVGRKNPSEATLFCRPLIKSLIHHIFSCTERANVRFQC